ncbi:MAG: hypothetical protein RMK65_06030, partial [Anaerolineae bacterium]|nr:hypothetical protein [Anaerolineae bacterium]
LRAGRRRIGGLRFRRNTQQKGYAPSTGIVRWPEAPIENQPSLGTLRRASAFAAAETPGRRRPTAGRRPK